MSDGVTPMMAQYLAIKAEFADALLFYRMGDFYELFFADAELASAALDIALTRRGQHLGQDIVMCGVPAHAAEGYLLTLIRKGFRVAIAEQTETPEAARRRGAKSVVAREVVRLVTPGTLTEDTLLEARQNNFLSAWAEVRDEGAFAWVDVSTGEFTVAGCARAALSPMLARISPRELLVSEAAEPGLRDLAADLGVTLTPLARASFDSSAGAGRLERLFGVAALDGFGSFGRADLAALGAIADYLALTQRGRLPLLRPPVREPSGGTVLIDAATRRNLELTRSLSGGREGSLLRAIDRTVTGGGARLLEQRLSSPSTDLAAIRDRLDAVAAMAGDRALARRVREALRRVPDIERALSRLALGRGGPRDLAAIRDGLAQGAALSGLLSSAQTVELGRRPMPALLAAAARALEGHAALAGLLEAALVAEPPYLTRDGGFVAAGHDAELDATRALRDEGRAVIAALQAEYAAETGIAALKIRHNNVLGYFIETPDTHQARMMAPPLSQTFIHRQTTANQVRFTTLRLSELETRILNAGAHALDIERAIFDRLVAAVLAAAGPVGAAARALAEIDLAAALADIAADGDWVRPHVETGRAFAIRGGRHPVVEQALRAGGGSFVANDCDLGADAADSRPLWLLTGPNMAGKSTFLRQNALIAVLAQAGSFVPAAEARIGIVDALFSRVGAADDLARGRSTFMVEMVETAAILNQAGPGALVILDEIGRGTATWDGLSIAWAVLEHLHDVNRCRTLFATHYHELTALSGRLAGLRNATVSVRDWEGEVIFLHEVREGVADRSYGVQVARLAGLPPAVTDKARAILDQLESGAGPAGGAQPQAVLDDLPLFSAAPLSTPQPAPLLARRGPTPVEQALSDLQPDEMTPLQALEALYRLKSL
jgi:DNA mismatch repair protein MutS